MDQTLDFERPVLLLEKQIQELRQVSQGPNIDISHEIDALQKKVDQMIKDIYGNLGQWQRVQLARHPLRPHGLDYISSIVDDFHELAGDRYYSNDSAIIAGLGYVLGKKVAVIAIEKGRKTNEKIEHNFGMPRPEGYRKALRVMELAARFHIPVLTLVDTPGAYPGVGAEERGQSQAIAENLAKMFSLKVPILSVIVGEGGSGGALGIAIADRVFMMEFSIYSVISPESCASILWADSKKAEQAATALQLGPQKALELQIIDGIVPEPAGGAHRGPKKAKKMLAEEIKKHLDELDKLPIEELLAKRFEKFRKMGHNTLSNFSDHPNHPPEQQERINELPQSQN